MGAPYWADSGRRPRPRHLLKFREIRAFNLATARLRYIAGTAWSSKRYMNMQPLWTLPLPAIRFRSSWTLYRPRTSGTPSKSSGSAGRSPPPALPSRSAGAPPSSSASGSGAPRAKSNRWQRPFLQTGVAYIRASVDLKHLLSLIDGKTSIRESLKATRSLGSPRRRVMIALEGSFSKWPTGTPFEIR